MKYIIIILFFVFGISNAQSFESNLQEKDPEEKTQFFEKEAPAAPEQGESVFPTGPGEEPVPLDDWLFLLPLAGIAVGAYFLNRRHKAKA